jgi:hypothetical protein
MATPTIRLATAGGDTFLLIGNSAWRWAQVTWLRIDGSGNVNVYLCPAIPGWPQTFATTATAADLAAFIASMPPKARSLSRW